MSRLMWVLASGVIFGCGNESADEPPRGQREIVELLGTSEIPVRTSETPEGFVDFFVGQQVLSEYEETGTFVPGPEKRYSRIRVPERMVRAIEGSDGPVVYSLCDGSNGIELMHQAVGPNYVAPAQNETNCTPWVQKVDGRMTIRYRSGQPGVFGRVSVHRNANGTLGAGAMMVGQLPADQEACPGDTSVGNSSMLIGTVAEESAIRDPEVRSCMPAGDIEPNPSLEP